jgi:chromosome transmission fidelity protein 1
MSEFESDSEDSKARSSKQLETLRRQYSHNNDNFDNDIAEDAGGSEEEDVCERQKIIIASRTHSQLAQLVSELKKTAYVGDAKVISLGSRRQMCINKDVQRLRSVQRMNDKCKDLLKSASGMTIRLVAIFPIKFLIR